MKRFITVFALLFAGMRVAASAGPDSFTFQIDTNSPILNCASAINSRRYYGNLGEGGLEQRATLTGMDSKQDLVELADIFRALPANGRVMEFGIGYGRVIDWVIENYPHLQITGVEQFKPYADAAVAKYRLHPQVRIVEGSVLKYQDSAASDLVLWLWSGIQEFNPMEQVQAFRQARANLTANGLFIIDIPSAIPGTVRRIDRAGEYIELQSGEATLTASLLTRETLERLGVHSGLRIRETREYTTRTGIPRTIYLFELNPG